MHNDESTENKSDVYSPFQLDIGNVHGYDFGTFTIPLPVTMEELQPFLDGIRANGWWDIEISESWSDIGTLDEVLNEVIKTTVTQETLDELNYLAARIQSLDEHGRDIFYSIIETGKNCGSIAEIISLTFAENINCFDLLPFSDEKQYGDFLLNMVLKDEHLEVFDRLYNSDNPKERALAEYIENLESHIDYYSLGRAYVNEEKGTFTEQGYLTGGDGIQSMYNDSRDIPDEYRIFTKQGEIYKPLMKLDDEDIAAALMQIHAVCGGEMCFTEIALQTLFNSNEKDFLLSVNHDELSISPAVDAYKRGSEEYAEFFHTSEKAAESADSRFFAIRVMNRGEDGIFGDFVELNGQAFHLNLLRHGVAPDRIDVRYSNDATKSYDMWDWAELPTYAKDDIINSKLHYSESDLMEAAKRYDSFMGANEMSSEAMSVDTFLSEMNTPYMALSKNPCHGMLRITNDVAKQILVRGDADVFKLTPEGAEKLARIEAARSLCFADYSELAIKCESASALEKWSKSAVKDVLRRNERSEHKKAKTKEGELNL